MKRERNLNPIDIEQIDVTEDWILDDDEEPPTLDTFEVEHILAETAIPRSQRQRRRARDDGGI